MIRYAIGTADRIAVSIMNRYSLVSNSTTLASVPPSTLRMPISWALFFVVNAHQSHQSEAGYE